MNFSLVRGVRPSLMIRILSSGDLLSLRGILALNDAPTAVVFRCTHSCLSIPMVARPLNVRPGFSEVYDKHEVEGLADWVGGCRGGILGVEGDTPYLIRQWPVFARIVEIVLAVGADWGQR